MKLYEHQTSAISFLADNSYCGGLIHDMGIGKTVSALTAFKASGADKLIVVCPKILIENAWGDDYIKVDPEWNFCNGHKEINEESDIIAINFESFWRKKSYMQILEISKAFNCMIVIDESAKMKNHKSKITKSLLSISPRFKHRIILSAIPTPNSLLEWWGQINFH